MFRKAFETEDPVQAAEVPSGMLCDVLPILRLPLGTPVVPFCPFFGGGLLGNLDHVTYCQYLCYHRTIEGLRSGGLGIKLCVLPIQVYLAHQYS